jgi:hypothetical protein
MLVITKYETLSLKRHGGNTLFRLYTNNPHSSSIIMKHFVINENEENMRSDIITLDFAREVTTFQILTLFNGKTFPL